MRGLDEIKDGNYELPMDDKYSVKVKGSKPTEGTLIIEKGKVKSAEMCINKYFVEYENGKAKSNGKCAARPQMVSGTLKVTQADGTELQMFKK